MPTPAPDQKLGPYQLISRIGIGGMGEVWKARDVRIDRIVAVKFPQERFSERFRGEARAIAQLNHPNIATLYDLGPDYLVMEFVDGMPLRPPRSIRKVLELVAQIADGLAAAHAAGIVHRDLKPNNILVTKEGRVKIVDFGLAKQKQCPTSVEEIQTATITEAGTIVGTTPYMSPEQASATEVDARSDQFSFGSVMYELLTRMRAFQRNTAAETITAVLRESPKPLPACVPAPLRWVVDRCLEKDPAQRCESTRDLYYELRTIRDRLSEAHGPPDVHSDRGRPVSSIVALILATVAAVAGVFWYQSRSKGPELWAGVHLGGPRVALSPRISPDGQLLAFLAMVNGNTQVGVMKPDAGSWTVLTNQSGSGYVANLGWSRDGTRLYFDRTWDKPRGVYMIRPLGGEPILLTENAWGAESLSDGSLIVGRPSEVGWHQVTRFWPDSGRIEPLPAFTEQTAAYFPVRALPDGRHIVFYGKTAGSTAAEQYARIWILDLVMKRATPVDFGTESPFPGTPLAVGSDAKSLFANVLRQDTLHLMSVPLAGHGYPASVLTLPLQLMTFYIDVAADGSIYMDHVTRPSGILEFTESGMTTKSTPANYTGDTPGVVPVADGRFVIEDLIAGKKRLLIGVNNHEFVPFLTSDEESAFPVAPAGKGAIAFRIGPPNHREIAVASLRDRRVIHRMAVNANEVRSLAASPSGGTIYYASGGFIWAVSVGHGEPRRLLQGDSVALNPAGSDLYVKQNGMNPIRLVRVPARGGQAQEITIPGSIRLSQERLTPTAVDGRGRIVVEVASPGSFYYGTAIIDPSRSIATRIPLNFDGDVWGPGWMASGHISAIGAHLNASLWHYQKIGLGAPPGR